MLSVNAQMTHWRKPRGYAKITLPVYATKAHAMSELLSLLTDLVAIDSVNPDLVPGGAGEGRMADYIAAWGRANGLETHVQQAGPGRPNVILIARGRGGGRSLMLNAHTDTVGVEGMDSPFTPAIRDGRVYGRGAYDMKSGLAAGMLALKAARDMELAGGVMLSAVVDEEYGSIGTEALLAEWRRWPADAVLIAEPTELAISIAHRGFVWLEIETFGVAAHGSRPNLGVDAIVKMGQVLVALDAHDRQMRAAPTHDLLGSGSLHASIISGGEEVSMYPAHCKLLVERRTLPGETAESVEAEAVGILDEIAAADPDFKAQARATFARSAYSIEAAHPLVQQLKRAAESRIGAAVALIGSSWWMDSALFGEKGLPTVVLGPAGTGAHAREEWVDLASVEQCRAIYTDLIAAFCR